MSLLITSVFTVRQPDDQHALYSQLELNAAFVLQVTPGFVSSTLSRSDDGTTVVHQAIWENTAAIQAMLQTAGARESMAKSKTLADVTVIRSHLFANYRRVDVR